MPEQSAAAAQPAPSRSPVKASKSESISERIERLYGAISRRAFELFERDGHAHGHDVSHWLEAEKEFLLPVQTSMEETDRQFVVRAKIPGFAAKDIEINVEPRRVAITGKRETKQETKEGGAHYVEESTNEIFRAIDLPSEVNTTKVSATLKDGVLNIQIPKSESKKSAVVEPQVE